MDPDMKKQLMDEVMGIFREIRLFAESQNQMLAARYKEVEEREKAVLEPVPSGVDTEEISEPIFETSESLPVSPAEVTVEDTMEAPSGEADMQQAMEAAAPIDMEGDVGEYDATSREAPTAPSPYAGMSGEDHGDDAPETDMTPSEDVPPSTKGIPMAVEGALTLTEEEMSATLVKEMATASVVEVTTSSMEDAGAAPEEEVDASVETRASTMDVTATAMETTMESMAESTVVEATASPDVADFAPEMPEIMPEVPSVAGVVEMPETSERSTPAMTSNTPDGAEVPPTSDIVAAESAPVEVAVEAATEKATAPAKKSLKKKAVTGSTTVRKSKKAASSSNTSEAAKDPAKKKKVKSVEATVTSTVEEVSDVTNKAVARKSVKKTISKSNEIDPIGTEGELTANSTKSMTNTSVRKTVSADGMGATANPGVLRKAKSATRDMTKSAPAPGASADQEPTVTSASHAMEPKTGFFANILRRLRASGVEQSADAQRRADERRVRQEAQNAQNESQDQARIAEEEKKRKKAAKKAASAAKKAVEEMTFTPQQASDAPAEPASEGMSDMSHQLEAAIPSAEQVTAQPSETK
uniref:Uncharacterized protein n=1 Tax=Compsopogon caeruleus TaxID=31354 RepID=A0A7S1TEI7_9RHOD|mmetsp:Transcript_2846/g.5293  ORF Transcript_2846/g.5293 Transcript_2846/m.5293 type:complete len:585 (+) Transcript_2846:445-2199(+)